MFHLTLENEQGSLSMGGGGHRGWRVTAIEGLGAAGKEFNTVKYAFEDGQRTLSSARAPRTITISGTVDAGRNLTYELARAVKITDRPCFLKLWAGGRQRKIRGHCVSLDFSERNRAVQPFVLQLSCDDPCFTDLSPTRTEIFSRRDLLATPFSLPTTATERASRAQADNRGEVNTQPLFRFTNLGSGRTEGGQASILLQNETTGQHFQLDYDMQQGETVTVDMKERTVESNMPATDNNQGNLICYISDDSYFSDFWLIPGANLIAYGQTGGQKNITAVCEHENRYLEAIL